jgi:RNA polymerase sigma-70 factor (ECF subfamily)
MANDSGLEGLLADTALGSRSAFEALYRATSRQLYGICLRVLGDRDESQDVLQEVYTAVWRQARQFDQHRGSAMTWLALVARSRAIDRRRAQMRSGGTVPIENVGEIADAAASPMQSAQWSSDRRALDNCLEQLDERRRSLIQSAFFQALTYEELARRSGSPLGSVKSWIRRGLMQLRECLES